MRMISGVVLLTAMSGCVGASEQTQPKAMPVAEAIALTNDDCGRSKYAHLIGQSQSRLFESPEIPSNSIHYGKGASIVMVVDTRRLNFVNNGGYAAPEVSDPKIVGVFCG